MSKKLTSDARGAVTDFVAALVELRDEEFDGYPSDLGHLFDDDGDEDGEPLWPLLEVADVHYWLGYLHCAADVLGCEPKALLRNRAAALAASCGPQPQEEPAHDDV